MTPSLITTPLYEDPVEVYLGQDDRRRTYVEARVNETVKYLTEFPLQLLFAFESCLDSKKRPLSQDAHRAWAGYYEGEDLMRFRFNRQSYFSSFGLNHIADLRQMGQDDAERLRNDRVRAMKVIQESVEWKTLPGDSSDYLFHFRPVILETVDRFFTGKGADGNVFAYPTLASVEAAQSLLQERLRSLAPGAIEAKLGEFGRMMDEFMTPERDWFTLPPQALHEARPIRFCFEAFLPSALPTPQNVGRSGKQSQQRYLEEEIVRSMKAAGMDFNATFSRTEYVNRVYDHSTWYVGLSPTTLNPFLNRDGEAVGLQIWSPFLKTPQQVEEFNAVMHALRGAGLRTNSTTTKFYDISLDNNDLNGVKRATQELLKTRLRQTVNGNDGRPVMVGYEEEVLARVGAQNSLRELILMLNRTGYEAINLGWLELKGEGNAGFIRVLGGKGAPDGNYQRHIIADHRHVSDVTVVRTPRVGGESGLPEVLRRAGEPTSQPAAIKDGTGLVRDDHEQVNSFLQQTLARYDTRASQIGMNAEAFNNARTAAQLGEQWAESSIMAAQQALLLGGKLEEEGCQLRSELLRGCRATRRRILTGRGLLNEGDPDGPLGDEIRVQLGAFKDDGESVASIAETEAMIERLKPETATPALLSGLGEAIGKLRLMLQRRETIVPVEGTSRGSQPAAGEHRDFEQLFS